MNFSAGTVLDNYKLLARVGAGSCGAVWQAENIVSGELEALKILSDGELAERELRALKLYREINHPALIRVRHIGQVEDVLFYTMDWCESSLAERKVSAKELLEIAKTLTEGLAALHAHRLLHRDIKPANIFFRQGSPVLGDIGLLTRLEGATFAGSPGFLSPAILSGKVSADCYSDCYALAKSIYCALSGMGPEQFPLYMGEMTQEASLLIRTVMAVCSEDHTIKNAEAFFDFLTSPPQPKRSHHIFMWTILAIVIAGTAAGGALWIRQREKTPILPKITEVKQKVSPVPPTPLSKQPVTKTEPAARKPAKQVMDQSREEIERDFMPALSPEAREKLKRLQLSAEANRLLGGSGQLQIKEGEEKHLLSQLSPEQQNIYRDCCSRIKEMQEDPKWNRIIKQWQKQQFNFRSQMWKLEAKKEMDAMSALQQVAGQEPLLAFWVVQAKSLNARKALIEAAEQKEPPDFSPLITAFSSQTEECCKRFSSLKL